MDDIWHKIIDYQTLDLVEDAYYARHGRKPSKTCTKEITSNFIQAQEYFINAEKASLSVRPLLLYYGVLGLSRGLILILESGLSEAAMKPGHGINTVGWQQTLSDGLIKVGNLEIKFSDGTFYSLLEATKNKSYMKHNCGGVNFAIEYTLPAKETRIKFKDLMTCFPDLSHEYNTWTKEEALSVPLGLESVVDDKESQYIIKVRKHPNVTEHKIRKIFPVDDLDIEEQRDKYIVKLSNPSDIFLTQLFDGAFHIGDIWLTKPITESSKLAIIPSLYCASYYLGMLSRYFPSVWMSLGRISKGDCILPLINKLLSLIRDRYPEVIFEFLKGPYNFERKNIT